MAFAQIRISLGICLSLTPWMLVAEHFTLQPGKAHPLPSRVNPRLRSGSSELATQENISTGWFQACSRIGECCRKQPYELCGLAQWRLLYSLYGRLVTHFAGRYFLQSHYQCSLHCSHGRSRAVSKSQITRHMEQTFPLSHGLLGS